MDAPTPQVFVSMRIPNQTVRHRFDLSGKTTTSPNHSQYHRSCPWCTCVAFLFANWNWRMFSSRRKTSCHVRACVRDWRVFLTLTQVTLHRGRLKRIWRQWGVIHDTLWWKLTMHFPCQCFTVRQLQQRFLVICPGSPPLHVYFDPEGYFSEKVVRPCFSSFRWQWSPCLARPLRAAYSLDRCARVSKRPFGGHCSHVWHCKWQLSTHSPITQSYYHPWVRTSFRTN